jgi:hypothetical protein
MANDLSENLRDYLLSAEAVRDIIAERIHQDHVPDNKAEDYIWFRRANQQYEHCLDDDPGERPRTVYFDVECSSRNVDRAATLAEAVKSLFPYRGVFGDATVKGAFANDHDEDYIPLNEMADDGVYVQAVQLEICP